MIKQIATAATLTFAALSSTNAGVIVSATSVEILSGFPGSGDITSTYDLFGLIDDYESGVTDFDAYIASNPLHVWDFDGIDESGPFFYEWFSEFGTPNATVSYDLGSVQQTQGMALWNEDGNGIGSLNILGSIDGLNWVSLGSNLSPTNHEEQTDYGADVFSWSTTSARYIKMEMSNCPSSAVWVGCSIGEVAFNVSAVPEPSSLAMLGAGFALMGAVALRRRQS